MESTTLPLSKNGHFLHSHWHYLKSNYLYFHPFNIHTASHGIHFEELKQAALVNTLRGVQLFAGLPPADLYTIADIAIVKSLEKGDYLFRERDLSAGFYIVQKGSINIHRVNAVGKEQIIQIFRAGQSFAEATLATDCGYPADARALESSQILLVQKAGSSRLLKRQPELALRMLASMSMHLRSLVGQLEDLTLKDVETRLANWLVNVVWNRIRTSPSAWNSRARNACWRRNWER